MRRTKKIQDAEKLISVYRKFGKDFYGVGYRILEEVAGAEDVVQSTIERLMGQEHKIGALDDPKTKRFLLKVCRNVAIDMYNKRAKLSGSVSFEEKMDDFTYDEDTLLRYCIEAEGEQIICDIIKTLDEKYHMVFMLKYLDGYSNEEIAEKMGITQENVRKRLERSKAKLVKLLEKEGTTLV